MGKLSTACGELINRNLTIVCVEYCGGQVCDLYDHIQKKNDGNGLDEIEAKHIFRQVSSPDECKSIFATNSRPLGLQCNSILPFIENCSPWSQTRKYTDYK